MGKISSKFSSVLGRFLKIVVVALLLPLAWALLMAVRDGLELAAFSGGTFRQWAEWGLTTYVAIHVLLFKPEALFRASHRLFSSLAVWLFGGQVSSTEGTASRSEPRKGKHGKEGKGERRAEGSALVAFSPYVFPLYTILVCVAGWALRGWTDRSWVDGPAGFLIGWSMGLHVLMTADDLQEQRAKWHVETYLLAISLVFIVTLVLAGACLPMAVPEFSFPDALANGLARARQIYTTFIQALLF